MERTDLQEWQSQTNEVLQQDQHSWSYLAYRTGRSSSEITELLNSTRHHIALTFIHKLTKHV